MKKFLTMGAAAFGGVALALSAGAGLASADPIVDSTCSYDQVVRAANAQGPMAAEFIAQPQQAAGLRQFINSPPAKRQQLADQIRSIPSNAMYLPIVETVFNTCNSY